MCLESRRGAAVSLVFVDFKGELEVFVEEQSLTGEGHS